MIRHLLKSSLFVTLAVFVGACGGGSLDVSESAESPDAEVSAADAGGMGQQADAGIRPGTQQDAGASEDADSADAAIQMDGGEMDAYMPPTQNVPQSGPTVGVQVTESCSTSVVKGLSTQLIEQMNCLRPGIMKSFAGAPDISYSGGVFPVMQGPATDAFTSVAANYGGSIPVNSALRTIPQQYLLYRWYQLGLCNANLAAPPGRSNHNGGLAVDIGSSGTWAPRMRQNSFDDNVSSEPWHFFYLGADGEDVRNLSVLAFQQLYNLNFPEDPIDEDGIYGPQTEGAMRSSPANGFAEPPYCPSTRSLQAFPWGVPVETQVVQEGGEWSVRTIVPSGVTRVEYWFDGELQQTIWRDEHPHFEAALEGEGELVVVAFSDDDVMRQSAAGWLAADGFFIRPFDVGLVAAGFDGDVEVVVTLDELLDQVY